MVITIFVYSSAKNAKLFLVFMREGGTTVQMFKRKRKRSGVGSALQRARNMYTNDVFCQKVDTDVKEAKMKIGLCQFEAKVFGSFPVR